MLTNPDGYRPLEFMKPKIVHRFKYRDKIIIIEDHGEGAFPMRYWWVLPGCFADLGGRSIWEAMQEAKHRIDNVEGMHGAY